MRILVLGSSGFIGRNLVKELSEIQNVALTGFGRTSDAGLSSRIRFHEAKFEDVSALRDALQGQDIVYHLISQTIPSSSWATPVLDIESNLTPSIRLIELAAAAGVKKICFASSGGTVYGIHDSVLTENTHAAPFSPYGIVKRSIESFLHYGKLKYGLNYNIYRISNVYGDGQDVGKGLGFINTVLEDITENRPVVVYGDGENIRDFIHVKDVARLLAHGAIGSLDCSDIFNLSGNRPISLNELLKLIRRVVDVEFQVEYHPERLNDNKKVMLDNSKIMESVGKFSLIGLEDGIRDTYLFLKGRSGYAKKSF